MTELIKPTILLQAFIPANRGLLLLLLLLLLHLGKLIFRSSNNMQSLSTGEQPNPITSYLSNTPQTKENEFSLLLLG